jgi:hypothetical protein
VVIASLRRVAALVRTRRNGEKLNWKRVVFKSEITVMGVF